MRLVADIGRTLSIFECAIQAENFSKKFEAPRLDFFLEDNTCIYISVLYVINKHCRSSDSLLNGIVFVKNRKEKILLQRIGRSKKSEFHSAD
jgi:hypothetical protein